MVAICSHAVVRITGHMSVGIHGLPQICTLHEESIACMVPKYRPVRCVYPIKF